ncbi:adenosylcobinamide-GDP ribazoletransferase [Streptomyces sp. NPDC001155]
MGGAPALAGVVPAPGAPAVAAAVTLGAAVWGAALGPYGALRAAAAVLLSLAAAELLLRRCVRRFGGVTGDVFGALAETAATASLIVLALGH